MAGSFITGDIPALLSSSDFGEDDGAVRNGDTGNPIPGIFDDEDVEQTLGEGMTVIAPQACFTCASSQVPDLVKGDIFTIRGDDYTVEFWKDDKTGMVDIFFEKD